MKARLATLAALAVLAALPAGAQASFGLLPGAAGFDASLSEVDGSPAQVSGSHPYEMGVQIGFQTVGGFADGDLRDLHLALPPGLLANPSAIEQCNMAAFNTPRVSPYQESLSGESCPNESQVGVLGIRSAQAGGATRYFGVFNLLPPRGAAAAIGSSPFGVPVLLGAHVREGDAALTLDLENLAQGIDVQGIDLTLWGTPTGSPSPPEEVSSDPRTFVRVYKHDNERANCLNEIDRAAPFGEPGRIVSEEIEPGKFISSYIPGTCSPGRDPDREPPRSYLSLPTSCQAPLRWEVSARSWQDPGLVGASALSRDGLGNPVAPTKCTEFRASAKVQLRTDLAATATGLLFNIEINDGGGLLNEAGRITSPVRRAVARLPEGLTINPSVGSGLGACTAAEFAREGAASAPGAGCPNNSKIGTVSLEGVLGVQRPLHGSVFLAEPRRNPFGALIAVYLTAADPERGLFLKSVGKVEPDPRTGRLVITFEDLPVLHYTHLELSLREGQRAMLISPPACGAYQSRLELNPWSNPATVLQETSTLAINRGEAGGPCPSSAGRPFAPRLEAGSLNAAPGAFSPFYLHMTRTDAEQEITSYSATFPPGLLGKIAGLGSCPEAAIEAAKAKSGVQELQSPSCPASASIGHTLAGYGVGGVLAYAPGGLYLAGPYKGSQFSVVAIDSALVGPFDLGVVVVRSAIRLDPRTARVSIDSAASDPIPHILEGIPLHLRDIRVYVDRPNFTVNPTSCDPLDASSLLTGAGFDLFEAADDVPAASQDRFQLLGCSDLGFEPRLTLRLRGPTKRSAYPSFRATYRPRAGDANLRFAAVTLPPSLFLAQEHLKTICTNKQFAAEACPPRSIYGKARALTPLMEEPLEGPVYLRTSSNQVPDLVAVLRARGIQIEAVGRIDSSAGGIRGVFDILPDAPLSKFTMTLPGGKRGLLVNAEDLCASRRRAHGRFIAHNNATAVLGPRLNVRCSKQRNAKRGKRR